MLKYRARFLGLMAPAALACLVSAAACEARILEDIRLVDSPTAGVLPHRGYMLYGGVGPESSILVGVGFGLFDRLLIGGSYGFQKLIGRGEVFHNERPGLEARLRLIEESANGPAFAIGVDSQGEDFYDAAAERYERKSKGAYAIVSKNYRLIEDFSIHGGVNYSFETKDERGVNAFGGFSLEIIEGFSVLLDYNAALDDNDRDVLTSRTRGKGYLDSGVCLEYGENLQFKVYFKDLLNNYEPASGVYRSFEIFYLSPF